MENQWDALHIDVHGRSSGHLRTYCPQCRERRTNKSDKSLSVNLNTRQYYCFYCNWKGVASSRHTDRRMGDLPMEGSQSGRSSGSSSGSASSNSGSGSASSNSNSGSGNSNSGSSAAEAHLPPDPLHQPLTEAQLQWFATERRIPQEALVLAGVTSATEYMPQTKAKASCICFNFFEEGELVNTKFRDRAKNFKLLAGARLVPYNIDAILGTPELIITEGEIDALSFVAVGRTDVISVPNGAGSHLDWLDLYAPTHFDDKQVVYIAVDTDRKGRELRQELLRRLGKERCRVVSFGPQCKDANELLVAQGADALLQALVQAPEVPLEGIFTATDLREEFRTLFEGPYVPQNFTGLQNFDQLCTLETGREMVISGIPGSGKSEFADELCVRLCLRNGWRIGYFSPENTPITYHLRKLAERLTGQRFRQGEATDKTFDRVVEWLTLNVSHILPRDGYTVDTILSKARELVRRKGIRAMVVDPYNSLEHRIPKNMSETQYISSFLDKLRTFAVRNDCLVILVAHPHKMQTNPATGRPFVPGMYDINGSAGFFNKADYGLMMERDPQSALVTVHVQKVKFRHLGLGGKATFCFGINNGRYNPCRVPQDPQGKVMPLEEGGKGRLFDSESWI